jgi:hypothetical protein
MKQTQQLFVLIALFLSTASFAQTKYEITRDSITDKWGYTEVFDVPDVPQAELYKRIRSGYIRDQKSIQFDESPNKVVIRYQFSMGGYKYGQATETFDFKDGKVRWAISDISVFFNATSTSIWKSLENANDKSAVKWWNERMPTNRTYVLEKLTVAGSGGSDW